MLDYDKAMRTARFQARMFETEDLPLFSNTPIATEAPARFSEKPAWQQHSLPAKCPACLDTGRLDDGFCWCPAGDEAREAVDEMNGEGEMTYYDYQADAAGMF